MRTWRSGPQRRRRTRWSADAWPRSRARSTPLPRIWRAARTFSDPSAHDWLAPDETLGHLGSARWVRAKVPEGRIVYRSNSLLALAAAARAGMGIAPLPCFLADPDPGLARIHPPLPEMASVLWLLTHPDLRRVARVRALLDFMALRLAEQRPLLEGRLTQDVAEQIWT